MPLKCPYCGFVWKPRVANPRSCPRCKRYFYKPPERVDADVESQRLTVPKIREEEMKVLPTTSYLECDFCNNRAIVHMFGHNLCREHLIQMIERKISGESVTKPETVEEELPFEDYLVELARSITNFEEMVQLAMREAERRGYFLPESEIRRMCERAWHQVTGVPSFPTG